MRLLGAVAASIPSVSTCIVTTVPPECLEPLRATGMILPHYSDDGLTIESATSQPNAIGDIIENPSETPSIFKDFQGFRQHCGVVTGWAQPTFYGPSIVRMVHTGCLELLQTLQRGRSHNTYRSRSFRAPHGSPSSLQGVQLKSTKKILR